ncbi:MAG: hypothetical protein E7044_08320 [Lentisphaerae bacterium]|nr:hypothetical protein [Lentisphaerota bacterium]
MIVSIMLPVNARYEKECGTHLWFFYKQAVDFSSAGIRTVFIGWDKNFLFPDQLNESSWVLQKDNQEKLEYSIPEKQFLEKADIIPVDEAIFKPLEEKFRSNNLVWTFLMTQPYEPYMDFLRRELHKLEQIEKIEAVVVCCNSPSVEEVGRELGIPVIHTEIGPTRKKQYLQTAYWDLSGVNGKTEAAKRFRACRSELKEDCLSKSELRALFMTKDFLVSSSQLADAPDFKTGVAGQVEDDSNMFAYSCGFNNLELLKYVNFHFGKDNVLFRRHPLGQTLFSANLDLSPGTVEFLKRIEQLVTINSSMALEACLWDKPVMVMGDSPFSLVSDDLVNGEIADDGHIEELNFLCLNYIIPYKYMFDPAYYSWRLTFPSEKEIRRRHLEFYCREQGFSSLEDFKTACSGLPDFVAAKKETYPVLPLQIFDIPYWKKELVYFKQAYEFNAKAAAELSAKLEEEVKHYQHLLEEKNHELSDYRAALSYNEGEVQRLSAKLEEEVKHYQHLLEEKNHELSDYRAALSYNEGEVQRFSAKLEEEIKYYQAGFAYHESEIARLNAACSAGDKEISRLAGVLACCEQNLAQEKKEKEFLEEKLSHLPFRIARKADDCFAAVKRKIKALFKR